MSTEYDSTGRPAYGPGGSAPQPSAPMPAPRPSGGGLRSFGLGCLVAALAGCVVIGLVVVALVLLVFGATVGGAGYTGASTDGVLLREVTVSGVAGLPKVAMVPVRGVLTSVRSGLLPVGGPGPVVLLKAMLSRAAEDPDVEAVILVVNSPGGGITTCDVMHKAMADFREETGVPIVALMEGMAASGGYYVSCSADHIIAHPTTITGSIGVVMPMYDASRLMGMLGVVNRTVKSGEFKDMGSMFAEKTAEQRDREKAVLTAIVADMHERFVQVVADGRGMDVEAVRKLADGRIYTADQALANGLIDSKGYQEGAIEQARSLIRATEVHAVRYTRQPSLRETLLMRDSSPGPAAQLGRVLLPPDAAPLMYLWTPPVPAE